MDRIANIILRVRDTLADPSGDRWADERLLRLIDEAQKDIVRQAKILRTHAYVPIYNYTSTVYLPKDLLMLERVVYKGKVLKLISHTKLDAKYKVWEETLGTPEYLVYDKQAKYKAKLYPIPDNIQTLSYTLNDLGIITEVEGIEVASDFGVTVADKIPVDTALIDSDFGVTTDMLNEEGLLVYYIRKPKTIVSLDSILDIDDIYDTAIKYYVTGKALRDDMDAQNRLVGNEELGFYTRELAEAIKDNTHDFTNDSQQYAVSYTGAFND